MIVLSRATTGRPPARASATSGWMSTHRPYWRRARVLSSTPTGTVAAAATIKDSSEALIHDSGVKCNQSATPAHWRDHQPRAPGVISWEGAKPGGQGRGISQPRG